MTNRERKLNRLSGLLQWLSFCIIVIASLLNAYRITIGVCCLILTVSSIVVLFLSKNVRRKRQRRKVSISTVTSQRKTA